VRPACHDRGVTAPAPPPPPAVADRNPRRIGRGREGRPGLGWTELVVAVPLYLLLSILTGTVLLAVTRGGTLPIVPLVALSGLAALLTVVIVVTLRVRSPAAVGLRGVSWRWLLLGLGAGLAAFLVNRLVVLAYVLVTGDLSNPQQDLADAAAGPQLVWLLLAGGVFVPLCEELLFRGVGFGSLRRYGWWVAAIVSSLLFGVAHGFNVVLPAAVLLGLLNCLLYERSGSIWPGVVAHGVNNLIAFSLAAALS
jgi:uncharacterized protein